jgi:hypothetical protein
MRDRDQLYRRYTTVSPKPCCRLLPVRHSFPFAPRLRKTNAETYACSARFTKRMPRKIRYASPRTCQGRPIQGVGQRTTRPWERAVDRSIYSLHRELDRSRFGLFPCVAALSNSVKDDPQAGN